MGDLWAVTAAGEEKDAFPMPKVLHPLRRPMIKYILDSAGRWPGMLS